MKEQYSTQQLNQNLPEVLEQISQGNSIEITQAGEPFAVILSASEYEGFKQTFMFKILGFNRTHNV